MLHWLHLRRAKMAVDELTEHLKAIGVVVQPDSGRAHYFFDEDDEILVKEVGGTFVYPDGRILVAPRVGCTEHDRRMLLAHAELSFREKPSRANGWRYKPPAAGKAGHWVTVLLVTVGEDDPHGRVIEAARARWNEGYRADLANDAQAHELAPERGAS